MFKEFRDFAIKGNMVDLAIGVIIGAAFGAIVSSLVDDVFMPIIGLIIGGIDFSNLFVVLNNPSKAAVNSLAAAKAAGVSTLNIGLFINAIVKFVIIALVLFFVVKGINSLKRKPVPDAVAPAAPSATETLLGQIRDALLAKPKTAPAAIAVPLAAARPLTSAPASDTARPITTAAANPAAGSARPASATKPGVSSSAAAARPASGATPAAASSVSTRSATPASATPPASPVSSKSSAAAAPKSTPAAPQRGGTATKAGTAGAGTSKAAATSGKAKGEDWAADVLKYSPAANAKAIAGIVRYCGIALRNRDSSLVAFSDKTEVTYVREHFLKKKLALTLPDAELDSALDAVGERMKADRTKNRVTVYYLLAERFGVLSIFGG